jgi:hypothetical protein
VLYAEKDFNLPKHPEIEVPNLHVIKLMQSFKSKELVTERFAWRHYYWFLTNKVWVGVLGGGGDGVSVLDAGSGAAAVLPPRRPRAGSRVGGCGAPAPVSGP